MLHICLLALASVLPAASNAEIAANAYHDGVTKLQLQDFAGARRGLSTARRLAKDDAFISSIELQLGEVERRSGHYAAAMAYFQKVAHDSEALAAQAHARAGQMAIEYRRYPQARALLQAQLWANPGAEERDFALWGLGWVAFRTGDFDTARAYFSTLRAESPDSIWTPAATYWQARALAERGDDEASRAILETLFATWPSDYYGYRAQQLLGAAAKTPGVAGPPTPLPRKSRQDPYMALVRQAASVNQLDPDLLTAVIHQESRFNPKARSPVGALGLMQLMPATGKSLWREERRHAHQTLNLYDPLVNVRLGARLLARLVRSFSHQDEYALATYNAGTTAVMRWRTRQGDLPTDIFVEEIPYAETRAYVKKVLAHRQLTKRTR